MGRLFDSNVTIEGSRGASVPRVSLTVPCCPMDGSLDEPFSGSDVQSTRRLMTFVVKSVDLGGLTPEVGDSVITEDGKRFAVRKVQPFFNREFVLDCRSC